MNRFVQRFPRRDHQYDENNVVGEILEDIECLDSVDVDNDNLDLLNDDTFGDFGDSQWDPTETFLEAERLKNVPKPKPRRTSTELEKFNDFDFFLKKPFEMNRPKREINRRRKDPLKKILTPMSDMNSDQEERLWEEDLKKLRDLGMFEITRDHVDLLYQKKVILTERFRVSNRTIERHVRCVDRNDKTCDREYFMTPTEFDKILRIQLAQVSKDPKLQSYTGKWNLYHLGVKKPKERGEDEEAESASGGEEEGNTGTDYDSSGANDEMRSSATDDYASSATEDDSSSSSGDITERVNNLRFEPPVDANDRLSNVLKVAHAFINNHKGNDYMEKALSRRKGSGDDHEITNPNGETNEDEKQEKKKDKSNKKQKKKEDKEKKIRSNRFGKISATSIRHGRKLIYLGGDTSNSPISGEMENGSNESTQEVNVEKQVRTRIELCYETLYVLCDVEHEIEKCPMNHVSALDKMQKDRDEYLNELFKTLTLNATIFTKILELNKGRNLITRIGRKLGLEQKLMLLCIILGCLDQFYEICINVDIALQREQSLNSFIELATNPNSLKSLVAFEGSAQECDTTSEGSRLQNVLYHHSSYTRLYLFIVEGITLTGHMFLLKGKDGRHTALQRCSNILISAQKNYKGFEKMLNTRAGIMFTNIFFQRVRDNTGTVDQNSVDMLLHYTLEVSERIESNQQDWNLLASNIVKMF